MPKYYGGDEGAVKDLRNYSNAYIEIFKLAEK